MKLANHLFPLSHFTELARGNGNRETVELLLAGERSRRLLLLRALLDALSQRQDSLGQMPAVATLWTALSAVEARNAGALFAVLMSPQFGVWLSRALRVIGARASSPAPAWVELGHVYAAAFAAAVRAGINLSTRIPVSDGYAVVPTLGVARFPSSGRWRIAEAQTAGGRGW